MAATVLEMLGWLLTYLMHSTVALALAWAVASRMPRHYDAIAESVWRIALLLPAVSSAASTVIFRRGALHVDPFVIRPPDAYVGGTDPAATLWLMAALCAGWVGGAALRVVRLARGHRKSIRALGPRLPWRGDLLTRSGLGARVTIAQGCDVPMALGGEICLPARALTELTASELRCVLLHELAHERRRDPRWRMVEALAAAVFFFQPLNRLAVSRLRALSELLCDADALSAQQTPGDFARALVKVAQWTQRRDGTLAAAMIRDESLTMTRFLAALGPRHRMLPAPPSLLLPATLVVLVLAARVPPAIVESLPLIPYTVYARDYAGAFSVRINRGRVENVTIGGRALRHPHVRQTGADVVIADPDTGPFRITLNSRGGITWQSRTLRAPGPLPPR